MNKQKIVVVGAGVSGLVAAIQLEVLGYTSTIYEKHFKIGGRLQSEVIEGYILDEGFQVVLSAYPLAKKYLDYNLLDCEKFESGTYIFNKTHSKCIGDVNRDTSLLFSTLFSSVGTLADKLKIYRLSRKLKNKSLEAIFNTPEITTLQYLKAYGFSKTVINNFFIPFFTGIFLEPALQTSSRMFEFIFKMFSEGEALVPKAGIQAIPQQLASKLQHSTIKCNQSIKSIMGNTLTFEDGNTEVFDYCIVATEASNLIPNLAPTTISWNAVQTLYFEVNSAVVFPRKMIGLLSEDAATLINSICFPPTSNTPHKLLSVTVVKKHNLSALALIESVKNELKKHCAIETIRHLKTYTIHKSLPNLKDIRYNSHPSETQLTHSVFLAGDVLLNGSLNAAMLSGELAAQAIHEKSSGTLLQ